MFLDNIGIGAAPPRRPSGAVGAAALLTTTLYAECLARLVSIPSSLDSYLVSRVLCFPFVFIVAMDSVSYISIAPVFV